jgi:hypothetical protein
MYQASVFRTQQVLGDNARGQDNLRVGLVAPYLGGSWLRSRRFSVGPEKC